MRKNNVPGVIFLIAILLSVVGCGTQIGNPDESHQQKSQMKASGSGSSSNNSPTTVSGASTAGTDAQLDKNINAPEEIGPRVGNTSTLENPTATPKDDGANTIAKLTPTPDPTSTPTPTATPTATITATPTPTASPTPIRK